MILGIDIGATKTQLGRLHHGKLLKSKKIATNPDPARFLDKLRDMIQAFLGSELGSIKAIGAGAPGPLDPEGGVFGRLPNLPD